MISWKKLISPPGKAPKDIKEWLGLITDTIKKLKGSENWYDDVTLLTSDSIINDLDTGGVNKALSSEQGKILNQKVIEYGSQLDNKAGKTSITAYMLDLKKHNIFNDGTNSQFTTEGINNALIFAKNNGFNTVVFPKGTYKISKNSNIELTGNLTVDLNGSTIVKEDNNKEVYAIITISGNHNTIKNGTIIGDRENHDYGTSGTHEWGMGIHVASGSKFTNIKNLDIYDTTGYGICTESNWGLIHSFSGKLTSGCYSQSNGLLTSSNEYTYLDYKFDITNQKIEGEMFSLTGNGYANPGIVEPLGYYMTFYDEKDMFLGYSTLYRFYDDVDLNSFKYLYPTLKFIKFSILNSDVTTTANICVRSSMTSDFLTVDNCEIARCRTLGIAITGGKHVNIKNCKIHDIGGAMPGWGVDIEDGYKLNQYVSFENCSFYNNRWGDIISVSPREVIIDRCKFQGYKQQNNSIISQGVVFHTHSTTAVNYVIKNSNFINSNVSGAEVKVYDSTFISSNRLEGHFIRCNVIKSQFINYMGTILEDTKVKDSNFLLRWGNFEIYKSNLNKCTFMQDSATSGNPVEKYVIESSIITNMMVSIKVCKEISIKNNIFKNFGTGRTNLEPYIGFSTKEKSYIDISNNFMDLDIRGSFIEISDTFDSNISLKDNKIICSRQLSNMRDKIKITTTGNCTISSNDLEIAQLDNAYFCINVDGTKIVSITNNILKGVYKGAIKTINGSLVVSNGNIIKGNVSHEGVVIGENIIYS